MKVWPFNSRRPFSIGLQLLLAVNLLVSILLCGLLFWQYEDQMKQAIREKRSSLTDEAIAVHAAVAHFSDAHKPSSIQRYIDSVCQQMRNAWSPHHHIIVRLRGRLLSDSWTGAGSCSHVADIDSNEREVAADGIRSTHHVQGAHANDGLTVVVSETTNSIRRAARKDILTQLAIFAGISVLAAVTVNVMLLRIVDGPLKKLLAVVEQISGGRLGTQAPAFHTREMQQLAMGINSMSHALDESDRERRLQMHKAREIQQHLLPSGVNIPHLQTAHAFEPADDVGGDYYDFLPLSDGTWLICLADVTGHGVPAAMEAAILRTLLVTESESDSFDLLSTMSSINRRFAEATLPGTFATMFLGRWNPNTLELTYASAGHEPALVIRESGRFEDLESTGLLLGIDVNAGWELLTVQLLHDDRLLLFSDGATESQDMEGRLFGRNQLCRSLASNSGSNVSRAVATLCRTVAEHRGDGPLRDDLTLVLLSCDESHDYPTSTTCDLGSLTRHLPSISVETQISDRCVTRA